MQVADRARCGEETPGARRVDLSNCGLREVPAWVRAHAATLEELNLSGNALVTLPDWLAECTQLRVLFCSQNAMTALPSVVGRLPNIFMVSFKSNELTVVPPDALAPSIG